MKKLIELTATGRIQETDISLETLGPEHLLLLLFQQSFRSGPMEQGIPKQVRSK